MITAFSYLTVFVFLFLTVYNLRSGPGKYNDKFFLRILSGAGGCLIILEDCLLFPRYGLPGLLLDTAISNMLLLFYPCSFEKDDLPMRCCISVLVFNLLLRLLFVLLPDGNCKASVFAAISVSFTVTVFLVFIRSSVVRKFSGIRMLFRNDAVWYNIEEYSRLIYCTMFLCLSILSFCMLGIPGISGIVFQSLILLQMIALYVVQMVRITTQRTMIIGKEMEVKIRRMIEGNIRAATANVSSSGGTMDSLYKRIVSYMESKKPFLDSSFDMADMTKDLYSNKLYLSRTINIMSGRNFRQFVNNYRIRYAMNLMKQNPRLKVQEISGMSGFNSVVSFNMAFKVNLGKTPSEWMKDYLATRMLGE